MLGTPVADKRPAAIGRHETSSDGSMLAKRFGGDTIDFVLTNFIIYSYLLLLLSNCKMLCVF